ncbi:hypothetical protein CAJAP_10850 [Camponotus japonicus]
MSNLSYLDTIAELNGYFFRFFNKQETCNDRPHQHSIQHILRFVDFWYSTIPRNISGMRILYKIKKISTTSTNYRLQVDDAFAGSFYSRSWKSIRNLGHGPILYDAG